MKPQSSWPDPQKIQPARRVDQLTADMKGRWIVQTQGSQHIWDLDAMTYKRLPGTRSQSGDFPFDRTPMTLTRVERWPRVGDTSLVWYDDPTDGERTQHWRQSSGIISISELQIKDPRTGPRNEESTAATPLRQP